MNINDMRKAWGLLLEELVDDNVPKDVAEDLFTNISIYYIRDGRFYHNMGHISHMLGKIDELLSDKFNGLPNMYLWGNLCMKMAAWYHDIYYDPFNFNPRLSNEFFSAAIARRELTELGMDYEDINTVEQLILLTQKHETNKNLDIPIGVQEIFLDADMAILGEEPEKYLKYSENIAAEYLDPGILASPLIYFTKRKDWLENTIKTPIYHTYYMLERYKSKALLNMTNEISRLDKLIEEEQRI